MKKVTTKDYYSRQKNASKGFTILELLVVVAILIVLVALGIMAGTKIIRNVRQSHLDKRAEAIYYAAESRMMELYATEDKTEVKDSSGGEEVIKSVVEKLYKGNRFTNEDGEFAYITSDDGSDAKNLFMEDKTLEVELGGTSWVIEYDPVSLDVYAVIISEDLSKAGADLGSLAGTSTGSAVRGTPEARNQAYNGYVGYYSEGTNSGTGAGTKNGLEVGAWLLNRRDLLGVIKISADENTKKAIKNLSFKICVREAKENVAESDVVEYDVSGNEIYWQNYGQDQSTNYLDTDGQTGIVITTDDVRTSIPATCFGDAKDNSKRYALIGYIKLDSLDKDLQFKDIKIKDGGKLGDKITPGKDIMISAKVWDSGDGNSKYSEAVRSGSAVSNSENSLYYDFDVKGGKAVAEIVYPRHLQNLDYEFSKVKASAAASPDGNGAAQIAAILHEDIVWDEEKNQYKGAVRNFTPISNDALVSFNGFRFVTMEEAVPLETLDSIDTEDPEEMNNKPTVKEDKYHFITGLRIDTTDGAYPLIGTNRNIGLFGNQKNLTVANLVLRKFDIKNNVAGQATGVLAGKLTDSHVKNIYIYNFTDDAVTKKITGAGSTAGLAGEMSGTSVDDCVLENIVIEATGAAGALAGKADGNSEIRNVLAYNKDVTPSDTGATYGTTVGFEDSTFEISGAENVGGLIGDMTGGNMTGCAAALYVRAASGNAGGLIGRAGSGVSVNMCQAGGHTIVDESGQAGKYNKNTTSGEKGRVNVIGATAAGGFVGVSDGATIQNSYSTCSATAGTVGGFAGSSAGGNIVNCYAACQVFYENEGSAGGFIGSGGDNIASNHYFEIINEPKSDGSFLKGVGGTEKDVKEKTRAIDEALLDNSTGNDYEYNKFMLPASDLTIARGEKTHRYEAELQPVAYSMKFTSQLSNLTPDELFYVQSHYGDWPVVGDIVVNPGTSLVEIPRWEDDPLGHITAKASAFIEERIRVLAQAVITEPIPEEDKQAETEESSTETSEEQPAAAEEKEETSSEDSSEAASEAETPESSESADSADSGDSGASESAEPVEDNSDSADSADQANSSEEAASNDSQEASDEDASKQEGDAQSDSSETASTDENSEGNAQETSEDNSGASEETQNAEETKQNAEAEKDPLTTDEEKDKLLLPELENAKNAFEGEMMETEEMEESVADGVLENEDMGIRIFFDEDAEIPEGSVLEVTDIAEDSEDYDYSQLVSDATEAMETTNEDVASYKVLDIAIMNDGEEIQPKAPVKLEIRTEQLYKNKEVFADDAITAVHMKSDEPEVIETTVANDAIEEGNYVENPASNDPADSVSFETDSFSVYVLVQPIQQKKVYVTDDNVYNITVDYDNASGIPANAELVVSEIGSGDEEFATYVEEGANEVGASSEYVTLARVFDISFIDPETGDTYQPTKDVRVSAVLMQDDIESEDEEIKVVHFGDENQVMDSVINEGAIEFDTDGFSAYAMLQLDLDLFDASLANRRYYISCFQGGEHHYLGLTGTTLTTVTDKDDANLWEFTSAEEGYKIHNGDNYLKRTDSTWALDSDENASIITVSDMGEYHWLCEARSSDTQKYLGFDTDYTTAQAYGAAGNNLMLTYGGDENDTSLNGDAYYIRSYNGGNYITMNGTSLGSTTSGDDAPKWEFIYVRDGYKVRNGENYIGLNADKTGWVLTNKDNGAVFISSDMGDYHYLSADSGKFVGYGADGYNGVRAEGFDGNALIFSVDAGGSDLDYKDYDQCEYYISKNGNYLYKNGTVIDGTVDGKVANRWEFSYNAGDTYFIHSGDSYLKVNGTALELDIVDNATAFKISDMGEYHLISSGDKYLRLNGTIFDMNATGAEDSDARIVLSLDAVDNLDTSLDGKTFYIIGGNGWFLSNTARARASSPARNAGVSSWTFKAVEGGGYKLYNGSHFWAVDESREPTCFYKASSEDTASVFEVCDMGAYHLLKVKGSSNYIGFDSRNFVAKFDASDLPARLQILNEINMDLDCFIYTPYKTGYKALKGQMVTLNNKTGLAAQDITDNVADPKSEPTNINFANGTEPTVWHFEHKEALIYSVYFLENGAKKYLSITDNGKLTISDEEISLYIVPRLYDDGKGGIVRHFRFIPINSTKALMLDESKGEPYFVGTSNDSAQAWHYLATAADESGNPVAHTVHYIYNQDPDDEGKLEKYNFPITETAIVSGNTTVLKKPMCDYYVSRGKNYKHVYKFKGWRLCGTDTIYTKEQVEAGITVNLPKYTTNFEAVWELDTGAVIVKYVVTDAERSYGKLIDADGNNINYMPMQVIEKDGTPYTEDQELIWGEESEKYEVKEIRNTTEPNESLFHMYQRLTNHNYHTYEFKGWKTESGEIIKAGSKVNLIDYKNRENEVILETVWVNTFKDKVHPAYVNFSIIKVADTPDNAMTGEQLSFITESLSDYAVHVGGTIIHALDPDTGEIILADDIISPCNSPNKYWLVAPYYNTTDERAVLIADNAVRYQLYGPGYKDNGYMDNHYHKMLANNNSRYGHNYHAQADETNEIQYTWSIPYLPSDKKAFEILRQYNAEIRMNNTSEIIPLSELNENNYTIRWYFVKYQAGDKLGFHIDGKITKKASYITVTKTFKEQVEAHAIKGIFDHAKECYKENDTLEAIARKLTNDDNECFYVRLQDTKNKNHVVKLALYDRTKKDDTGQDIASAAYGQMGTYTDTYGYIRRVDKENVDGYRTVTLTWMIDFDEYEKNNTYKLTEKNYHFTDKDSKLEYGIRLEYNKTGTGNPDDEEIKDWDPANDELPAVPFANDTLVDIDSCIKTNLYNTYSPAAVLNIKKVDGNKKKPDGTEEVIKDVEFTVYQEGVADPVKLYKTEDGKYTVFFENDSSEEEVAKTDKDGFVHLTLEAPIKKTETKIYTIQEKIPEGRTGDKDLENPPKFKIRIDADGKITIKKEEVQIKPAYGKLQPCDKDWKDVEYEDGRVITNYVKLFNGGTEEVSFKKIDGFGKVLPGAKFKLYDTSPDGDNNTLDDVMSGNGTAYENITIKDGAKDVITDEVVSIDSTADEGNVIFRVPVGIYYMVETTAPNDFEADYYLDRNMPEDDDPDTKDGEDYKYHTPFVYKITVGNDNIKLIEGYEDSEKTFLIQRVIDEYHADTTLDVEKYGIIDVYTKKTKVLLRKVNGEQYPLMNKEFEILRVDKTVVSTNLDELMKYQGGKGKIGTMQKRVSGDAGAFYISKLSLGTYYLHEISPEAWYKIEVTDEEGKVKAVISDASNPFE